MAKETRVIKFYLNDKKVSAEHKQDILRFFNECQMVENKLIDYYWEHFEDVISAYNNKDFYDNRIDMPEPRLKFHHYMNLLFQVYESLKSMQSNIINNKLRFYFENKEKQRIYNYCKNFCFQWDRLEKYISIQSKKFKNKDKEYYNFLLSIKNYISNEETFNQIKREIEDEFWNQKSKINKPTKHEFQIRCNTFHTVDIKKIDSASWHFMIDNNKIIGGTDRKPKFDSICLPIKISNYHNDILSQCELASTFNLKLNKYGKIEIIGCYKIESNNTIKNKPKNYVGIDIGLKKLITTSNGEIIEQNSKIVKQLERVVKKQANRQSLEEHLKKKYNDEKFELGDKNYKKLQNKVSRFVTCDNRHRLKQFVLSCKQSDSLIVMEDLKLRDSKTNNRMVNNMIKRLHIQRIKSDILRYCKEHGVNMSLINSAFTSQQCPICGHISRDNRKTQENFKCIKCGHEINADFNASVNILNRYFDKRISLDTPFWRVKEILTENID